MHAFSLPFGCLVTPFLCLLLATKARSDELAQINGEVRDSSTQATAQPLLQENTSVKRWYINIEAARHAAKAAGMPIMIVFR